MNKDDQILPFEQLIKEKLEIVQVPFEEAQWLLLEDSLKALALADATLDSFFKENLAQLNSEFDPAAWQQLEAQLALENAQLDQLFKENLAQLNPEFDPTAWQQLEAQIALENAQLDQLFKENLAQLNPTFEEAVWLDLESKLHHKPVWQLFKYLPWIAAACIAIFMGSLITTQLWNSQTAKHLGNNAQNNTTNFAKKKSITSLQKESKNNKTLDKDKKISAESTKNIPNIANIATNYPAPFSKETAKKHLKENENTPILADNSTIIASEPAPTSLVKETNNDNIQKEDNKELGHTLNLLKQALARHFGKQQPQNHALKITLNPLADEETFEALQLRGGIEVSDNDKAFYCTEKLQPLEEVQPLKARFARSYKLGLISAWENSLVHTNKYHHAHHWVGGISGEARIFPKIALVTGVLFKTMDYKLSELTSLNNIRNRIDETYTEAIIFNRLIQQEYAPEILLYNHVNTFALDIPLEVKYFFGRSSKANIEWFVSIGSVASIYLWQTFSKDVRKANSETRLFLNIEDATKPKFYWGGGQVSVGAEGKLSQKLAWHFSPYIRLPYTRTGLENAHNYIIGFRAGVSWQSR